VEEFKGTKLMAKELIDGETRISVEIVPTDTMGQGIEGNGRPRETDASHRRSGPLTLYRASLEAQPDIGIRLEERLGRPYAQRRLSVEQEHEGQIFGGGINFFHIENWFSIHAWTKIALKASGLYWRGARNAGQIQVKRNRLRQTSIPEAFRGFTILQLSDLHCDTCPLAMQRLTQILRELKYDLCVLTGDYRGQTYGPYDATLAVLARMRAELSGSVYGVLGNHDTVRMVPAMEEMGIRMLLNESVAIERSAARIHLAGIDDAHFYAVDDIEKAASGIPNNAFSILLSHTPEVYERAARAGFHVMLSGHTHGGQICLPGGIPIELNALLPRRMGAGPWKYGSMLGYTSVGAGTSAVHVRFNCAPEVTLHYLDPT
jgi:predicted MPP superfamily phosphohydrolase